MTTLASGEPVVLRAARPDDDLFAVDPSLNGPGAAWFSGGRLVAAERVRVDRAWGKLALERRAMLVAGAIVAWFDARARMPHALVLERPKVYNATKSVADPADLIAIALVAGNVSGMLARTAGLEVIGYEPGEWSGGLPKARRGDPWSSPRGERIRSRLSEEELRGVVASHDALDAVGIGLHALGRFGVRRLYHGAV